MKGIFSHSFSGMQKAAFAALLILAPATALALAPGIDGKGPMITRPDGTQEDNGGIWGVMAHHADTRRGLARAYGKMLRQPDPSLAVSGFEELVNLSARLGAIYSDRPPTEISPVNKAVFNQGVIYNRYAGIGLNDRGEPNTLGVVFANTLTNLLDTYYGNMGNLQVLGGGKGAPAGISLSAGGIVGATFTPGKVASLAKTGPRNFAETAASDMGLTMTGTLSGAAQKVNDYLYGALTAPPLAIAGSATGGTDPARALMPFSTLHDAADYGHTSANGPKEDTWAKVLLDAISGPNGSMTILRAVAGSAPPGSPQGYNLSPSKNPNVLENGLPAYYSALCNVSEAKQQVYSLLNGVPTAGYFHVDACKANAAERIVLPLPAANDPWKDGVVKSFEKGFVDLANGYLGSKATSMSGLANEALMLGVTSPGFNRVAKFWDSGGRIGTMSYKGGPFRGMSYITIEDMVSQNPIDRIGNMGSTMWEEVKGSTSSAYEKKKADLDKVMEPSVEDRLAGLGVPDPDKEMERLESWKPLPKLPPKDKMTPKQVLDAMDEVVKKGP